MHARVGRAITADADIAAAVFGKPGLDCRLAECSRVVERQALPIASWPVEKTAAEVARLIEMNQSVRVILRGSFGDGRLQFACAVAETLGSKILLISPGASSSQAELTMRAQRLALLTGHGLFWDSPPPAAPPLVANAPVQFVAIDRSDWLPPQPPLLDLPLDLPQMVSSERQRVWRAVAPKGCWNQLPDEMLMGARVGDLVASACHAPRNPAEAIDLLRTRVRGRLESAGNLLPQPYDWSDLVLPPRQQTLLRTIVAEIRTREGLLGRGERLAKYGGLGQSALLHGPPGTGKTMVAQILARDLGVQLVRVDCASVVSKYIGDTARNLRAIFDCVSGSGALLFFDECDSLFAKRTEIKDAHDRHANADTNYLLQLIESFDGAALLATNKKDNVDPAFIRRLRHVVDFPAPGPQERGILWERHIVALSDSKIPRRKVVGWAARLARLDLTPAQIKGAALSAAFARVAADRAAPQLGDLLTGVERELAKDGRGLDRHLRTELMRND
jgi:tRNA A37 threonylcarbamoyladenosine biosynthesis protein TsaE